MSDDVPATRLVLADRIHTLDDAGPAGPPPDALLMRAGRVLAVGPADELVPASTGAELLDLRGCTVTPGLTDAHIHLLEWALSLRELDLADCRSPEECAGEVARAVAGGAGERVSGRAGVPGGPVDDLPLSRSPVGQGGGEDPRSEGWLRGRGWNAHHWGGAYPHRSTLDAVAPRRPVVLQSHDMHALWVNGAVLRLAGIGRDTPDPQGGRILRDESGEPTGVLLEMAAQLVAALAPPPTPAAAEAALLDGQAQLHRLGITGVHAFPAIHVLEPDAFWLLQQLRERDALRLRVLQHIPLERLDAAIALGLRSGFGDEWIRLGGVKLFLDGALGSRTALMREPYESDPASRGVEVMSPDALRRTVERAAAAGIAATVHAIGDAAVARALDVLSAPELRVPAMPHRIEHVQLCPPERLRDAAAAGLVCSMQPAHLITDWRAADRHWGSRARTAYAFRSLADAGTTLAFGSDGPVEPVDPRLGFLAAAARQDLAGEPAGGWYAEERLSMAEVLRGYTVGPALASGSAGGSGRLLPGSPADFVAWSADPLACAGNDLLELRCLATVVAGDVVWREG